METEQPRKPALPLLALLALASALGVAVAIALAGVAMLLAAPAYAGNDAKNATSGLLLARRTGMAEAQLVFAETESHADGGVVRTRVVEEFFNPFAEQLVGFYVHRLPGSAVLEHLSLAVLSAHAGELPAPPHPRPALLTLREGAGLVERTAKIGPAQVLRVELEYRTRAAPRVLASR